MAFKEDYSSSSLIELNKLLIQSKESPEYQIGHKLKIIKDLIYGKKYKTLLGVLKLQFSRKDSKFSPKPQREDVSFKQQFEGRIAVYTCIVGMSEMVREPFFISPVCDYFIITDKEISKDSIWKKIDINSLKIPCEAPNEKNRYLKLHPHIIFPEYQYSLYIDGNIQIVSDILPIINQMSEESIIATHNHNKRDCSYEEAKAFNHLPRLQKFAQSAELQMNEYRKKGFPSHIGLYENPIIIRKHLDKECIELMDFWWEQLTKYTMRDQISLPFVLWEKKMSPQKVHILGHDVRKNPRFMQFEHY